MTQSALVPAQLAQFWRDFSSAAGGADAAHFYEAFYFGDSQALADDLAALVLRGIKRATASSVWSYAHDSKPLPKTGDLSIVTTWAGEAQCVIQTQSVDLVPFCDVSAEFAAREGEGDGSLAYWQNEHRRYFTRECASAGSQFGESMLVCCECFSVVYQKPSL